VNREQRRADSKRRGQATPSAAAHPLLGAAVQHHQAGRLEEAEQLYRRLLRTAPRDPDALHLLGAISCQRGHPDAAAKLIRQAIAINPSEASYHSNLGVALKELGLPEDAVDCFRRAIALNPDQPDAHNSLGNALAGLGRVEEALESYRKAIILRPDYPEAHFNLGITLKEQERIDEAIACYQRAIVSRPNYQEAHYNLGNAFRDQRRLTEAIAAYRRGIALRPDFPDAHHNVALALLADGAFTEGWAEYEWRWRTSQLLDARRDFARPRWTGDPAAGRTLLIHAEQGFGDTLQFCRYATMAAARGMRVIMEVQPGLVRLLRDLPGAETVLPRGEQLPDFDLHCPMLSLPLAFRTTAETIPNAAPYLRAEAAAAERWRTRLAMTHDRRPRVGVAWAGKPTNLADHKRSIAPERLAPLFEAPAVQFVSLQKDGPPPDGLPLTDFMPEMEDFADTAALIANLDLVISVDTAVAHLAAALGKPVWLLDRFDACWRWLAGRVDSPWYQSLLIYRQPRPGDWNTVVADVVRDLHSRQWVPRETAG
jgi:Flp pilus assembly protein TadD